MAAAYESAAVLRSPFFAAARSFGGFERVRQGEQVRERLSRAGGGLHEHIQPVDDDRAQSALLHGGEVRDPRVAQARLGSLVFIFRRKMDGVAGRGERSDTCQTVFHFVPCDAARAGSVAPLGPSPRRSARRASTRARGATGAEAEDAAAGANVLSAAPG